MAYLQTPVQHAKGRRGLPRLERYKKTPGGPPMPPLEDAGHLVDYLLEVGPAMPTGQGGVPVSFGELQAWQQLTGRELLAWECETLRRLSRDYVSESLRAASPAAKAPWVPDEVQHRTSVDAGLRALFDGLIARQEAKASPAKRQRKRQQ